ncbi:MAG: bifunctional adenosylcobinamide kinase/adenosylcobinamide-phosphate guanylyltransferase [Planctomycetota bacterium]
MRSIVLVTGGSRSGKSAYAQKLGESLPGPRVFIATCPILDDEMRERIRKHQQARASNDWQTIEETINLADAVCGAKASRVVLVDCLTLWINNLMYEAQLTGSSVTEEDIARRCYEVLTTCAEIDGTVIFVTNEVGMGIIPENALARRFRDLVGRCNQVMAVRATTVTLLVAGMPLELKVMKDEG